MRQVVERAEFVRHGVANTEERVGKRHTGHSCRVAHLFTGDRVVHAVVISSGQVLENHLQSANGKTVCIIGRHNRSVSFECVGNSVDTGSRGKAFRCAHHHVSINDCHVRQKLIVSKRPFHAGVCIGDDCKRGNFRTGTCGSRNGDEVSPFAHFRESIDSLADIHEVHSHIGEIHIGMLIHDPHDFRRVHCGTAADGDDGIRLELGHLVSTLSRALERRVRGNFIEASVLNAHFVEFLFNRLGVAVIVKERVGNNKRLFLAHDRFQFVKRNRQAAFFEIHLFGCAEPQHIFPSFGNGFDIQQMFDTDVFGNRVAAPGAAAKCQRGCQFEVVKVADAALGRRCVDKNTAGLHALAEFRKLCLLRYGVQVHRRGVAVTAVGNQMLCLVECVGEILCLIHSKNRRQLFVCEFFGNIDTFDFTNQNLCGFGDGDAGKLRNLVSGLTNNFGVERAIDDDGLSDLFDFSFFQEIAAACGKFVFNFLIDFIQHDYRLLGSADHAVIKCFGVDN